MMMTTVMKIAVTVVTVALAAKDVSLRKKKSRRRQSSPPPELPPLPPIALTTTLRPPIIASSSTSKRLTRQKNDVVDYIPEDEDKVDFSDQVDFTPKQPDPIFQTDFSRPNTFLTDKTTNTIEILPTVKKMKVAKPKLIR